MSKVISRDGIVTAGETLSAVSQGQATPEELCAHTLQHYDEISLKAHHWSNQVPQAIKFWYLDKPKMERDRAELLEALQELADAALHQPSDPDGMTAAHKKARAALSRAQGDA